MRNTIALLLSLLAGLAGCSREDDKSRPAAPSSGAVPVAGADGSGAGVQTPQDAAAAAAAAAAASQTPGATDEDSAAANAAGPISAAPAIHPALITLDGSKQLPVDHPEAVAVHRLKGDEYIGRVNIAKVGNVWAGPFALGLFRQSGDGFAYKSQIAIEKVSGLPAIESAYDPAVLDYQGQIWVAFECAVSGLAGSAHTCLGRLEQKDAESYKLTSTDVVVQGHDFDTLNQTELSASVPKLFLFQDVPHICWTAVEIDVAIAKFRQINTRCARLRAAADGRRLVFADMGDETRIGSSDPRAVDVMNPLKGDPNSDLVADIYSIDHVTTESGESAYVAVAAVGGKTYPHDVPAGTYRIAFAVAANPFVKGAFDVVRKDNGLTTMAGEYGHLVKDGEKHFLRVTFRSDLSLPRYKLDRHPQIDGSGVFTQYPIVDAAALVRIDRTRLARAITGEIKATNPAATDADVAAAADTKAAAVLAGGMGKWNELRLEMVRQPAFADDLLTQQYSGFFNKTPSADYLERGRRALNDVGYAGTVSLLSEDPSFSTLPESAQAQILTAGWADRDLLSQLFSTFGARLPTTAEFFFFYRAKSHWTDMAASVLEYHGNAKGRATFAGDAASADKPSNIYREYLEQFSAMIDNPTRGAKVATADWIELTSNELMAGRLSFLKAIAGIARGEGVAEFLVAHAYRTLLGREAAAVDHDAWTAILRAKSYQNMWMSIANSAEFNAKPRPAAEVAQLRDPNWVYRNLMQAVFLRFIGSMPADNVLNHINAQLHKLGSTYDGLADVIGEMGLYRQRG